MTNLRSRECLERGSRRLRPQSGLAPDAPAPDVLSAPARRLTAVVVIALSVWRAGVMPAAAQLVWEQPDMLAQVLPDDGRLTVPFHFRNEGDRTVIITAVKRSCSCLSTALDGKLFKPGESGTLTVRLRVRPGHDREQRSVVVHFADSHHRPACLRVTARRGPGARLVPQCLQWPAGKTGHTRTVNVMVDPKLAGPWQASCDSDAFRIDWRHDQPGPYYRLAVTPVRADSPLQAKVTLRPAVSQQDAVPIVVDLEIRQPGTPALTAEAPGWRRALDWLLPGR